MSLSTREQVRLLMADTEWAIFSDDEVDAFLTLTQVDATDQVLLAAAMGLDTMAASNALVLKKVDLMGTETDGPAVAAALRDQAKSLRQQWKDLSDEGMPFGTAEFADDFFQQREYLLKQMLCTGVY